MPAFQIPSDGKIYFVQSPGADTPKNKSKKMVKTSVDTNIDGEEEIKDIHRYCCLKHPTMRIASILKVG